IGLGVHDFENTFGGLPPSRTTGTGAGAPYFPYQHSWSSALLPYIEQTNSFNLYTYKRDWNHPDNYAAIRTYLKVFNCPATPVQPRTDTTIAAAPSAGDYHAINAIKPFVAVNCFGITVPGSQLRNDLDDSRFVGAMRRDQITRISDITDGTSHTILVA